MIRGKIYNPDFDYYRARIALDYLIDIFGEKAFSKEEDITVALEKLFAPVLNAASDDTLFLVYMAIAVNRRYILKYFYLEDKNKNLIQMHDKFKKRMNEGAGSPYIDEAKRIYNFTSEFIKKIPEHKRFYITIEIEVDAK